MNAGNIEEDSESLKSKCKKKPLQKQNVVCQIRFLRVRIYKRGESNMNNITVDPSFMEDIQKALKPYPDPMSRNDFREACKIGTRTSLYLLKSGLVPCINTGKKTRCYKIFKKDVEEYLIHREIDPLYYTAPSGWYKNYPNHKPSVPALIDRIDYQTVSYAAVREYFEKQMDSYPDVLTVKMVAEATGYNLKTVSRWCTSGRLRTIQQSPKFMVPKIWLLDFMCSEDYNHIVRKSNEHNDLIHKIKDGK